MECNPVAIVNVDILHFLQTTNMLKLNISLHFSLNFKLWQCYGLGIIRFTQSIYWFFDLFIDLFIDLHMIRKKSSFVTVDKF